jgi:hypothetical protein
LRCKGCIFTAYLAAVIRYINERENRTNFFWNVAKVMLKVEDSGKKTNYVIVSPKNIKIPKINNGKTPAPNSGLA